MFLSLSLSIDEQSQYLLHPAEGNVNKCRLTDWYQPTLHLQSNKVWLPDLWPDNTWHARSHALTYTHTAAAAHTTASVQGRNTLLKHRHVHADRDWSCEGRRLFFFSVSAEFIQQHWRTHTHTGWWGIKEDGEFLVSLQWFIKRPKTSPVCVSGLLTSTTKRRPSDWSQREADRRKLKATRCLLSDSSTAHNSLLLMALYT